MHLQAAVLAALSAYARAEVLAPLPGQTSGFSVISVAPIATTSVSPECESAVMSYATGMPSPPPGVPEYQIYATALSELCAADGVAANATGAFASYNTQLYSWFSSASAGLVDTASKCADAFFQSSGVAAMITEELPVIITAYSSYVNGGCSSTTSVSGNSTGTSTAASTGAASTTATSTMTKTPSGASGSTSSSTIATPNAGPRETGMAAAAGLALGLIGAVVVL
ncbi:Uu.00g132770.m01.CDS01 [Anthostomella pinea]|uniref:Uu.00g132770.m01.CDS01 n=1 Tax=Anthostomella pinea TaxID=933095 RepID=A0AAI8VU32_9PEZI|nr:Uu.00g132770.m01.CDS01 [Anthostomella pinea]